MSSYPLNSSPVRAGSDLCSSLSLVLHCYLTIVSFMICLSLLFSMPLTIPLNFPLLYSRRSLGPHSFYLPFCANGATPNLSPCPAHFSRRPTLKRSFTLITNCIIYKPIQFSFSNEQLTFEFNNCTFTITGARSLKSPIR